MRRNEALESLFDTAPPPSMVTHPVRVDAWRGRNRYLPPPNPWIYGMVIADSPAIERQAVVLALPAGWSGTSTAVFSLLGVSMWVPGLLRDGVAEVACVKELDAMPKIKTPPVEVAAADEAGLLDPFEGEIVRVRLDCIDRWELQPRQEFDQEKLAALVISITNRGVLQPITLRRNGDRYRVLMGERRFVAAGLAGLVEIPAIIKDVESDLEALQIAFDENHNRADLNPIEEADAWARMVDMGMKQSEIATMFDVNASVISNALRTRALPDDVKKLISDGKLTRAHGLAILRFKDVEGAVTTFGNVVHSPGGVAEAVMKALAKEAVAALESGDPVLARLASSKSMEKGVPFATELAVRGLLTDSVKLVGKDVSRETMAVNFPASVLLEAPVASTGFVEPGVVLSLGMAADNVAAADVEIVQSTIEVEGEEGAVDEEEGHDDSDSDVADGDGGAGAAVVPVVDGSAELSTGAGDSSEVEGGVSVAGDVAGSWVTESRSPASVSPSRPVSSSTAARGRPPGSPATSGMDKAMLDTIKLRKITSVAGLIDALTPNAPVAPPGMAFVPLKSAEVGELQKRKLWPISAVILELDELDSLRQLSTEFYEAARGLQVENCTGVSVLTSAETDVLDELYPGRETTEWFHIAASVMVNRARGVVKAVAAGGEVENGQS